MLTLLLNAVVYTLFTVAPAPAQGAALATTAFGVSLTTEPDPQVTRAHRYQYCVINGTETCTVQDGRSPPTSFTANCGAAYPVSLRVLDLMQM